MTIAKCLLSELLAHAEKVTVYAQATFPGVILPAAVIATAEAIDAAEAKAAALHNTARTLSVPMVELEIGLNLPIPIPDLDLADDALTATLSFGRVPFRVTVPWAAMMGLKVPGAVVGFPLGAADAAPVRTTPVGITIPTPPALRLV